MFMKKLFLLALLMLCIALPSFAQITPSHVIGLRLSGSFDRSVAMLDNHEFKRTSGSFGILANYDFLALPFLSIGPEFAYFIPRTISGDDELRDVRLRWQELQAGLMMKLSIFGLLYMGYGLGVGYSFGTSSENTLNHQLESSLYPYFSFEIGGNIVLNKESEGMPYVALNVALRGNTNIALWKDPIKNSHIQNSLTMGLVLGVSIMWLDMSWLDGY